MSDGEPNQLRDEQERQEPEEPTLATLPNLAQISYAERRRRFLARGVSPLVDSPRSEDTGMRRTNGQTGLAPISESIPEQEVPRENLETSQDSSSVFTDSQSQISQSVMPMHRQLALRSFQSAVAMARLKHPQMRSLSASIYPGFNGTPVRGNKASDPFDPNIIGSVCQMVNSPSLFARRSSEDSNNRVLKWSPEILAILRPAKLDDEGVSGKERRLSSRMEGQIQAAIDGFFRCGLVHPSPQLSAARNSMCLTSTSKSDPSLSTGAAKRRVEKKNVMCQTLFTFPPNFDMDFFLGRSRFRLSNNVQEGNIAQRAFSRKLFIQQHRGDKSSADSRTPSVSKSSEGTVPSDRSMHDAKTLSLSGSGQTTCGTPLDELTVSFTGEVRTDALDLSPVLAPGNKRDLNESTMDLGDNACVESTPTKRNGSSAFYGDRSAPMLEGNEKVSSSTPANAARQKWPESLSTIELWNSHDPSTTSNEGKEHPTVGRSLDSGIASRNMTSHDNDM